MLIKLSEMKIKDNKLVRNDLIKCNIANASLQIDLSVRGYIIGMQYNLIPFKPKGKVPLYPILTKEGEVPQVNYLVNSELGNITPFYLSTGEMPYVPASKESVLPVVDKKEEEITENSYWEYKDGKYKLLGTDGKKDGKNFILKVGEEKPDNITPFNADKIKDKFITMPRRSQRESIAEHWNKYINMERSVDIKKSETSNDVIKFIGTFHEEGGVGYENTDEFVFSKGDENIPKHMGDIVKVDEGDKKITKEGKVNLLYHFHATARIKAEAGSSGSSFGGIKLDSYPYLYDYEPSPLDIKNIPNHLILMGREGINLQISKHDGINFLGIKSDGIAGIILNINKDNMNSHFFYKEFDNEIQKQ